MNAIEHGNDRNIVLLYRQRCAGVLSVKTDSVSQANTPAISDDNNGYAKENIE